MSLHPTDAQPKYSTGTQFTDFHKMSTTTAPELRRLNHHYWRVWNPGNFQESLDPVVSFDRLYMQTTIVLRFRNFIFSNFNNSLLLWQYQLSIIGLVASFSRSKSVTGCMRSLSVTIRSFTDELLCFTFNIQNYGDREIDCLRDYFR